MSESIDLENYSGSIRGNITSISNERMFIFKRGTMRIYFYKRAKEYSFIFFRIWTSKYEDGGRVFVLTILNFALEIHYNLKNKLCTK